jgi:hypothetical protein
MFKALFFKILNTKKVLDLLFEEESASYQLVGEVTAHQGI